MCPVKIKIQISHGKFIAFGPGKAQLLDAINRYGSISGAAKSMNMSYKRAWDLVMVMNASFKEPLVITAVGGSHGGGAVLSLFGAEVLRHYLEIVEKSEKFVMSESDGFLSMLATQNDSDLIP
ncbi:MAG TPA: ModE family transcriptional regulator [Methylotenera sp.]|nr:ModE family transcriptional regulator [Methylotenera sp.]